MAAAAGGLGHAVVVNGASIRIDEMGASDGQLALRAADLLRGAFGTEDSLVSFEEVAIEGLGAARAGEVVGVPVSVQGGDVSSRDLLVALAADDGIRRGGGLGNREGSGSSTLAIDGGRRSGGLRGASAVVGRL